MSDSVRPQRRQPTSLSRPWDSPGKNTGVGCHFLLQCMKVKSESEVAQSCPTLSDSMDCSLPGSSIHGIFQARVLEWVAIAFSAKKERVYINIADSLCYTAETNSTFWSNYTPVEKYPVFVFSLKIQSESASLQPLKHEILNPLDNSGCRETNSPKVWGKTHASKGKWILIIHLPRTDVRSQIGQEEFS